MESKSKKNAEGRLTRAEAMAAARSLAAALAPGGGSLRAALEAALAAAIPSGRIPPEEAEALKAEADAADMPGIPGAAAVLAAGLGAGARAKGDGEERPKGGEESGSWPASK